MRTVKVIYRQESDGAWIGTSPEIPGFVGHGDTYDEARDRVNDALGWFVEEDLQIAHIVPGDGAGQLGDHRVTGGARVSFTRSAGPDRAATPQHDFKAPRTGTGD